MKPNELKLLIAKEIQKQPEFIKMHTGQLNIDVYTYDIKEHKDIGFGCEFQDFTLYHFTTFADRNGFLINSNISYAGIDSINRALYHHD